MGNTVFGITRVGTIIDEVDVVDKGTEGRVGILCVLMLLTERGGGRTRILCVVMVLVESGSWRAGTFCVLMPVVENTVGVAVVGVAV